MSINNRNQEDRSVLALLYDEYRRTYPETAESIQREIETLYQQLFAHHLANPEEITSVFVGIHEVFLMLILSVVQTSNRRELVAMASTTAVGRLPPVLPGASERKMWAPEFSPQRTARLENSARPQMAAGRQGDTAASARIL